VNDEQRYADEAAARGGAFDYGWYGYDMDGREDERLGAAILAIKKELAYVSFDRPNLNPTLPVYGDAVRASVKDFQAARGLKRDGKVGPLTARELWRARIVAVEKRHGFEHGTLGRKIQLESFFDPVALGHVDPADRGMCQINSNAHPSVSDAEAFDPEFAIGYAAKLLDGWGDAIANAVGLQKAARAAYNVGASIARQWLLAGFPETGGPELAGQDGFARATKYVQAVDRQNW
jgi:hypothetical protein